MKKIISYIVVIPLIICLLALSITAILKNTILNKQFVFNKMEQIGFYDKTYAYLQSEFEGYIQQSGFDLQVIENLYTVDDLKLTVNSIVDDIYSGEEISIDVTSLKDKLKNNISESLNNFGIFTTRIQNAIDQFIDTIVQSYIDNVFPVNDAIKTASKIVVKVNAIMPNLELCLYIVIAILTVVLILINITSFIGVFKYLGITILSTGILLIVTKIAIYFFIKVDHLKLYNSAINDLIIEGIHNITDIILYTGIAASIIGIVFLLIGNIKRQKIPSGQKN